LAYAHEHGVFHRDIKPSNLVIDHNDQPCLIDFGLAHWIEDQGDDPLRGRKYGTPPYMSPEQVRMDPVLAASDIWSLGVVLYQLLTGEYPFRGRRRMLEQQIQHEEPRRPRELNDHVPRDLETICLKCLEKDPRNRYASAAALRDDLDRYLRDEPILARPIGPPTRVWRWCLRNRALASLIVTVISLVVLLSIFAVLLANSLQKERKLRDEIKWKHKHSIEFCITKVSRYVNDIDTFARSADTTAEADSIISLDDLAAGGPLEVSPVFTTEIPRIEALSEILLPMITGLLEDSLDPHVLATDSAADAVDALGDLGTSTAEAIRRLKFLEDRKSVAPADINEARMAYQSLLADVMDGLNQEASRSDSPVAQKAENELQAIRDTLNVKSDDLRVED
jgi:serine/threonine protein kinase